MAVRDVKGFLVQARKREAALKADYNRFLGMHGSTKSYLAEKTSVVARAANEDALQGKNCSKKVKLSGFSYLMGKARGVKVSCEECNKLCRGKSLVLFIR